MLRHSIACSLAAIGLLVFAVALLLPEEQFARGQETPEPASADVKLVAAEAPFFVTIRPADFLADPLAKAVVQDIPRYMEEGLGTAAADIEQITFAVVRGGPISIIRTKKAYDGEKLRERVLSRYGRFNDEKKDGGGREKPALNEKKVGGKTIYYTGGFGRWAHGWVAIDKTTYISGEVVALEALLSSKAKPADQIAKALAQAGEHSLVMALDGKRLRALIKKERESRKKEFEDRRKDVPKDKAEKDDKISFDNKEDVKEEKAKEEDDDLAELFGSGRGEGIVLLPYKPLLQADFAILTLDVGKTYKLAARGTWKDKDKLDDAETAVKSLLYVAREAAILLPKDQYAREFRGLKSLSLPLHKVFKAAKITRKDDTISINATFTPDAGLAKKVGDDVAEEKKNWDKRFEEKRERFKDEKKGEFRKEDD